MATQVASIGVGKLSSTTKYVDKFIVEIYSDSGYTVRIGQQTSTAQWNGSAWVQKDAIIFGGLVFGTTYYLRAAVIAPLTGTLSAWTTFNTAAGSASAPGCTYSGTFTATTSGIGYIVTPATVPTDIDHFEAVWVWDSSTPASTIGAYWTGQITNGNITFFVGGKPGDTAKVYVRAVNTSQQAQAWQLIDTRAVSTTWSGTTIGTIGDGTLLGTGGPTINSGSTGKVGLGGSPVSDNLLTTFGSGRMGPSGSAPFFRMNDTGTSGRNYGLFDTTGQFLQYDETASTTRTAIASGGQYGLGGSPTGFKFAVFGGSNDGVQIHNTQPSVYYDDTTVGSRMYQQYGLSNNFSVWDNTAASNQLILNSSGQYGVGGTPSWKIDAFGQNIEVTTAGQTNFRATDTTPTTGRSYGPYSVSGVGGLYDFTASGQRTYLNSGGQYGIGTTPSNPLQLQGDVFSHSGPSATNTTQGTNVGGRSFETATGAAHAMLDGQYGWNDVTAGSNRMLLNNAAQIGIGMSPSQAFAVSTGFLGVNLQGTQPSVLYTDSGNSRNWSFGARGGPALEMADETAGLGRTYLSTGGGYGIGASPGNDFYFANSNRSYFQGAGPGIAVNDTQASGRLYMMLSGSGLAQGYQIYNGTNANYPLMIDNSARTGLGAITPANPLDVQGIIQSNGSISGLYTTDRSTANSYALYASGNIPRLWYSPSGDYATFNPSTGAMGLGGTYTGDWISVQGASVLNSNKVVASGVRGYRYSAGSSATWLKLGTWVFASSAGGRSAHIDIVSAVGYNTGSAQQAHVELIVRSGNSTAAPNISGASYFGKGGSTPVTGLKIVAVGGSTSVTNGSWELWVNIAGFTDMIVSPTVDAGDTFTWAGTTGADPGAASSSIVVGVGGMVMNTGGTGTDAIIDSTGSPLSGGKRGFIGFTSSSNLVSGQKVGGDSGAAANGSGGFVGFNMTPTSYIAFSGDIIIQATSTVKVRINNTAGHQWSVASV